jgi:4-hydroxy-tetrahydrodipicolinate synthase
MLLSQEVRVDGLPKTRCLAVAIATPLTRDFHPDVPRLVARIEALLAAGCDGITLFGTTGEGAEFSLEDRSATLEAVIAAGVPASRLVVSIGALSIPDVVALARHATQQGVHGVLLMPPCVYRGGITEDATFRFFQTVIDRVALSALRLYLYHFPDICGVPITPQVVRRLDERYPGMIAGVKDSGGDLDFTMDLVRRFSHLSIFTGSEIHLPELIAAGARGTICGLANVMPRLMRAMIDAPTAFDRRALLPALFAGDAILSRRPFIPSAKAVVADWLGDAEWRRVIPPMPDIAIPERQHIVADFRAWDAGLPEAWRSIAAVPAVSNVLDLKRA